MEESPVRDVETGSETGGEEALVGNVNKLMVSPPGYSGAPRKGHLLFDACFESDDMARGAQTLINGRGASTLRSANIPVSLAPDRAAADLIDAAYRLSTEMSKKRDGSLEPPERLLPRKRGKGQRVLQRENTEEEKRGAMRESDRRRGNKTGWNNKEPTRAVVPEPPPPLSVPSLCPAQHN
ncbi:Cytosolic carboxypeptidase 6 [Liparis tanakae]|uniref:Cytosolic carboxypeptidase 6 n=1 Tax=Liparis tanakae TaxID=230148 RepID=A0A4Z2ICE1_9TELE|nr:Cytosolic carboxypeptidase 6 [Liparis tanakae]